MTLFDGKPLTEREVMMRVICTCEHTRGAHRGEENCTKCGCQVFTPKDGPRPTCTDCGDPAGISTAGGYLLYCRRCALARGGTGGVVVPPYPGALW